MMDARVLEDDRRPMVDEEEWAWIVEMATGDFDHLLLGTSLPLLLGPAMHHLQSWDEKLGSGAWGARAARWAECFRRSEDLDHWVSFHGSFAARLAGVPGDLLTWRLVHDAAFFDNQVATLELEDRRSTITFEKAVLDAAKKPVLQKLYQYSLA